jgi:hypothetical protein
MLNGLSPYTTIQRANDPQLKFAPQREDMLRRKHERTTREMQKMARKQMTTTRVNDLDRIHNTDTKLCFVIYKKLIDRIYGVEPPDKSSRKKKGDLTELQHRRDLKTEVLGVQSTHWFMLLMEFLQANETCLKVLNYS